MRSRPERFFPRISADELGAQLPALREKLFNSGTLTLEPNSNGIYAASASQEPDSTSGYQNAWLRDNVMVAFSRWECGEPESALKTVRGLTRFLQTQAPKMEAVIAKPSKKEGTHGRPHVRFDARTLSEIPQTWAHAQNDALGYVAWSRFLLANEISKGADFDLSQEERDLYRLFPRYFNAIEFWKDRDSGTWEEARKLNSSSVGAVVAALIEIERYVRRRNRVSGFDRRELERLIDLGQQTLEKQLPFESPPDRRIDAALLFLIYPLRVIKQKETARLIVSMVRARLEGSFGIRRYIGDSYYCQDYDQWFPPEVRSADFSNRIDIRDEFLQPGHEAQWCIFDSLLSVIYSDFYFQNSNDALNFQLYHFNRAIGQITSEGRCPELYYMKLGQYVQNEHTPLAWSQANLAIALHRLELTARGQNAVRVNDLDDRTVVRRGDVD
ncbi:MAG TPA: glycoside hydrolase family 15 protein [Candidatus Sulfotelmatobacter sp.]|nr:glycoside hydrolase family 15 protein [Candidatus Sulfotelmatobacter sp.]